MKVRICVLLVLLSVFAAAVSSAFDKKTVNRFRSGRGRTGAVTLVTIPASAPSESCVFGSAFFPCTFSN